MSRPHAPEQPRAPRGLQQRLWKAARVLRAFTYHELLTAAGVPAGQGARRCVTRWTNAGYLRREPDGWRVARDTGPTSPVLSTTHYGMRDRNTGEVFPFAHRPRTMQRKSAPRRQRSRA